MHLIPPEGLRMNRINIYVPDIVRELNELYAGINSYDFQNVRKHLQQRGERMLSGIKENKTCVFSVINNYNKKFIGTSIADLAKMEWSHETVLETLAQERGFTSWSEINNNLHYDIRFEKAIEFIIQGEIKLLDRHLNDHPDLVYSQSVYNHKAYLLHYCSNNGVEFHRQQVPSNLKEVISVLLSHGADKSSTMSVYGGYFTCLELMNTSAHPRDAGIELKEINEMLSDDLIAF